MKRQRTIFLRKAMISYVLITSTLFTCISFAQDGTQNDADNVIDVLEWEIAQEEMGGEEETQNKDDEMIFDSYIDASVEKDTLKETGEKEYSDLEGSMYENAARELSKLNVLNGYEDGTFRAEKTLTRAEFVAAVMRMITPGNEINNVEGSRIIYNDVLSNHWAYALISEATKRGLIGGFSGNRFLPDNPVTYNQAVKILVCALGYAENGEKRGGYPYGYLLEAANLGITETVPTEFENTINRGKAAQLMANSLDILMNDIKRTPRQIKSGVYATYYISPNGSDDNPGTEEKPWKTMYKSIKKLEAGSVLILEDGEYFEEHITVLENSGTEFAPIVIKARNKHKAKIIYSKDLICMSKFDLDLGVSYVAVEDIYFAQEDIASSSDPSPTADILLRTRGGSNVIIRGNYFEKVYEEGIKLHLSDNCIIEDNIVYGSVHEGIDGVNCSNLIVRNNKIIESGRSGIMFKGGTRDSLIYNNLVYNTEVSLSDAAFTVGGLTDKNSTLDNKEGTGFEMYNCNVYNNIVYSPNRRIRWGLLICSAKDTRVFNNIVMGTSIASVRVSSNMATRYGWGWDPPNRNVEVYNNIFKDSPMVYDIAYEPENFKSDYNIYSDAGEAPKEENSKYSDPGFVNPEKGDFTLKSNSPAIGAGIMIPTTYTSFDNKQKSIIPIDWNGKERKSVWDIGVYQVTD
ncbi:MAG: hypothetical protein E7392_00270 [Ruminococcaceae bacterium]|nr:hypothetical protein [Oscillospiraceae bacterium]